MTIQHLAAVPPNRIDFVVQRIDVTVERTDVDNGKSHTAPEKWRFVTETDKRLGWGNFSVVP